MHDIDRTNLESTYGEYANEFAGEYPAQGAAEYAGEYPGEYATGEFEGESESNYESPNEFETHDEYSQEGVFNEADEMELAAELLSVSNEAELEQFLGKIIKKAGGFVSSALGQDLMDQVRGLAAKALPMLGSAVGNMIAPGVGGAVGGKLAGSVLGLELEGLSYEDQEFEVAKQIVRLGGEAARYAAQAADYGPPDQVAHEAFSAAAQQYAPGLWRNSRRGRSSRQCRRCSHRDSGRWVRRGNAILLLRA
ncbi:MAG TPA: hypothetical protein VHQ64_20000 [Pyrinomonadaceae bacterium]|jgi:uncharacterized protein (DUF697 family)|nr:hypothetical protein [Pyrinomonadaceae bacterium]